MTNCEKIQEMISAMLDGEVLESDRVAIEAHIASCPDCAAMYEDFSSLSEAISEDCAEIPAGLHSKIMKGIRTSSKPRKPLIIQLRPYMSAAACLIVAVGAVFAFRVGDTGFSMKSAADASVAAGTPAATAAAPVAPVDFGPDEGIVYGDMELFTMESKAEEAATEPAVPVEIPAPEPMDDEMDISSAVTVTADRDIDLGEFEAYIPGADITDAWMIFYHDDAGLVENRKIFDTAALAALLADTPAEVALEALPQKAVALLRIYVGEVQQPVKLYFVGSSVIVETSAGFYMAQGSAEEFAAIK